MPGLSKNKIDMTQGPLFSKLLAFSIPLIFSSLLQLLFNAADVVVVGRFAGDNSLAAVGSTGSLINLLVNLFLGLSIGTNVVVARYFGAHKLEDLSKAIHTAMLVSIYSGIILTVIGVFSARGILTLMQAPSEVLELAAIYLRIYFGGITATMIYNFGSAILRAKGDTQRPLYILLLAGVINLLLNLFFVIVLKMDVAGVGLATVISQCISASLVVLILCLEKDEFHLHLRQLKINWQIFSQIVKIGLPAGFQGIMFSFSNVIIQSSVNSFGAVLIAGNSAACNLEGFIYTSMNGFSQGALTFCSQNLGAGKIDRIKRTVLISQLSIFVIGALLSALFLIFGHQLLGIYTKSPEVVEAGMSRLWVIFTTYYLCGMMDGMSNSIRGIGHSLMPVITSLLGACIFRIIWLSTVFQIPAFHSPLTIFISYPISWILTLIANLIGYAIYIKRLEKEVS
ncbi:MAG: MATE family efflux transporter [Treponema sp.]|nr:MATE family efflux transporter [Treponema sp.]